MKKNFLLFAACFLVINAGAQERQIMNVPGILPSSMERTIRSFPTSNTVHNRHGGPAAKTTLGGSRWYNYGNAQYYHDSIVTGVQSDALAANVMWNDTLGKINYTSGIGHETIVSEGDVFDPKALLFNHADPYAGEIFVGPTNSYIVDSIAIFGFYEYNMTKTSVVDTLRFVFMSGSGGGIGTDNIFGGGGLAGGGHYGMATFLNIGYDSITNQAAGPVAAGIHTMQMLLDNSGASPAWGDTDANGNYANAFQLATPISCSPGQMVGMSITFISGDPATHTGGILHVPITPGTGGDTLLTSTDIGMNKYNIWRPLAEYSADVSTMPFTTEWAPSPPDNNLGYWKKLPNYQGNWDNQYLPLQAWNGGSATTPSTLQYPFISYHVTCATCLSIVTEKVNNITIANTINAYPNPAVDELNISFDLNKTANVAVSLTNMIGQVVATQNINNVTTGKAVFNTTNLPEGIYIYNVSSNGERATGRVVVAH